MRTTIELPESIYRRGERAARMEGVTVEEYVVRALERELQAVGNLKIHGGRVRLPLIPSQEPGVLDLKDFNVDDLFA